MTIEDIKKQIREKSFDKFYIFTGPEQYAQKVYISKIADSTGYSVMYADSISSIYSKLHNRTMIAKPFIYVLLDDKSILSSDKLQAEITANKRTTDDIIVLILTSVDKRTKFYKLFKDKMIDFEHMKPLILKKYIKKEVDLSDSRCANLADICDCDLGRIYLELDKIKRYKISCNEDITKPTMTDDLAYDHLIKDGTIYVPPKDAIFDFVDAVLRRQIKLTYNLLEQCYAVGEANMVILSVLYTNIKQTLQVQSCCNTDVVKSTGLTAWQAKCAKERMGNYTNGELVYMLKLIRDIEKKIKTGIIDDSISVNLFLALTL